MGIGLSKPVTSKVIERKGTPRFDGALSSINGFREKMEDDHCMLAGTPECPEGWLGIFAVFDGHGGSKCSEWLGSNFHTALSPPMSDDQLVEHSIRLDAEYLAHARENEDISGSTCVFVIASEGSAPGKIALQIGNIGDSRVMVGKKDGNGWNCISMTVDHKPDDTEELNRIRNAGGFVANSRVNGNLALSRAFGDSEYKQNPSMPATQQQVTPEPTMTRTEVEEGDFILLCCDGVVEGEFSNEQVIKFVSDELKETGDKQDIADISGKVCDEAVKRGSRDNITCMIIFIRDGTWNELPRLDYTPGPFEEPFRDPYRKAYAAMAQKRNMTLTQSLLARYDFIHTQKKELEAKIEQTKGAGEVQDGPGQPLTPAAKLIRIENEITTFKDVMKGVDENDRAAMEVALAGWEGRGGEVGGRPAGAL